MFKKQDSARVVLRPSFNT